MRRSPPTVGATRVGAGLVTAGGALIVVGAFLPWLSLFAGLHPLRGVIGLNGRVLAAGGLACMIAGPVAGLRRSARARRVGIGLGLALTAFAGWLLVQQSTLYHEMNPMLAPRRGSGLLVALAGSLLVVVAGVLPAMTPDGRREEATASS